MSSLLSHRGCCVPALHILPSRIRNQRILQIFLHFFFRQDNSVPYTLLNKLFHNHSKPFSSSQQILTSFNINFLLFNELSSLDSSGSAWHQGLNLDLYSTGIFQTNVLYQSTIPAGKIRVIRWILLHYLISRPDVLNMPLPSHFITSINNSWPVRSCQEGEDQI